MAGIREEIAKNLLFYRKKAGLTQRELAEKLGVKNTAVSNWESGNNSVDIDTLVLACDIFGITLNEIYGKYSAPAPALESDEAELVENYGKLNREGKDILLNTSRGLVASGQYQEALTASAG